VTEIDPAARAALWRNIAAKEHIKVAALAARNRNRQGDPVSRLPSTPEADSILKKKASAAMRNMRSRRGRPVAKTMWRPEPSQLRNVGPADVTTSSAELHALADELAAARDRQARNNRTRRGHR
jgi:hypothetical protein